MDDLVVGCMDGLMMMMMILFFLWVKQDTL